MFLQNIVRKFVVTGHDHQSSKTDPKREENLSRSGGPNSCIGEFWNIWSEVKVDSITSSFKGRAKNDENQENEVGKSGGEIDDFSAWSDS